MSTQRDHATYMGGKARSNILTPLGSALHAKGITAHALAMGTGIHPRTLSDYLANRLPIRSHHMPVITSFLGVTAASLTVEPEGGWDGAIEKINSKNRGADKDHRMMMRDKAMMRPKSENANDSGE